MVLMFWKRKLDASSTLILQALAHGDTLKAHRHVDGSKIHKLHALTGAVQMVEATAVRKLERRGLIHSNKKFPAATYLLTAQGCHTAQKLVDVEVRTLSARADGSQ